MKYIPIIPSLYPYQVDGVKFLVSRPEELRFKNRKLLADEQGLGKTVQAIVAAKEIKASSGLIVCPVSVKYNWKRQMIAWGLADESETFVVRDSRDNIPDCAAFIVVNYDLLRYPHIKQQLAARRYDVGIFDEAHRLKTMGTSRSKSVLGNKQKQGLARYCRAKWFLTGTPVQNRPIEAYVLLSTQVPWLLEPYTKWVAFGRRFCNGYPDRDGERDPYTGEKWNFKGASNIDELRERLGPFMLRRELKDVYSQLPALTEEIVYIDVDLSQHPEIIEQMANPLIARDEGIFNPEEEMALATIRRIIAECKVASAFQYIDDTLQSVDKLVVFTYHRKVTEELAALASKYNPVVLYGGVNALKKQKLVDKFIEDPTTRLFIGQITASGEGIDGLQKVCDNAIFAEIDWSHGAMEQAKARLYRIGPTRPVFARYLLANDTIEALMAGVLVKKKRVINQLIASETKMTIEQSLERIATSLEQLVLLHQGGTAEKTKPAKAEVVDEEEEEESPKSAKTKKATPASTKAKKEIVTQDDLKDACRDFLKKSGGDKDDARKLIKKVTGTDSLTKVDEEDYPKLLKAFQDSAAKAEEADTDEDDGLGDL